MRLPLLLTLALAACEGGGKTTTSSASGTGTDSTSEGDSAGTTTDGDPSTSAGSTSTSTSTSTTTPGTTAEPTTDATTSTEPPVCSTLDEIECALADHCMSIVGDALNFPGCMPGPKFLFCNEIVPCDAVILTVCKIDSEEAYQLQNGCIPPGFEPCEPDLGPCGAACLGLDEQACQADPNCIATFGAPHTTKMGMQCADFKNPEFLACDVAGPPCPPAVVTVCPEDQPDTAFDVASGCTPPGFVSCMDGPLPECQ
jgi:hypothetical protein